ncbi:DUF4350 domain-containing protein [Streptomyces albidoflavus]
MLVARGSSSLTGLAPGTEARPPAERSTVAPACAFPAAQRAGDADVAGLRCSTDASGAEPRHPSAWPVLVPPPRPGAGHGKHTASPETILLGSSDILHNDRLDEHGNASLALQLLDSCPRLLWCLSPLPPTRPPRRRDPAASSNWSPQAGDGPVCNSVSPQSWPRSGAAAAWAPLSART